jgi:hypothetical protein
MSTTIILYPSVIKEELVDTYFPHVHVICIYKTKFCCLVLAVIWNMKNMHLFWLVWLISIAYYIIHHLVLVKSVIIYLLCSPILCCLSITCSRTSMRPTGILVERSFLFLCLCFVCYTRESIENIIFWARYMLWFFLFLFAIMCWYLCYMIISSWLATSEYWYDEFSIFLLGGMHLVIRNIFAFDDHDSWILNFIEVRW